MTILPILIITGISLTIGLLARGRSRAWVLLIASILAIYWLQPSTPIRNLDFWLPTASLSLSIIVWVLTVPNENKSGKADLVAGTVVAAVILSIGTMRYFGDFCCLTPSRPPAIEQIVPAVLIVGILSLLFFRYIGGQRVWIYGSCFLILLVLVILKYEPLAKTISADLRSWSGQSPELATGLDIRWLGFSYIAFRLLHTLFDRLNGRLPGLNLQEFIIYIIFFPSISAGPIDRVQRFIRDLRQPSPRSLSAILTAGKRILFGIFSKFVLADGLALFALSSQNAFQVNSTGWLWILLYAYAFRIYFDFSGYTDIAIGMGMLVGIQLPENFEKPYYKQNLTLFWNSWHMTLAGWFRAYFFNPLTRTLRSKDRPVPLPLIIFFGQLSTFILIGLWHGITWNFAIWGAWHGLGLFIHNRWTEVLKSRNIALNMEPSSKNILASAGALLTFHYVSLGWIWFALSSPAQSWQTMLKLFGLD